MVSERREATAALGVPTCLVLPSLHGLTALHAAAHRLARARHMAVRRALYTLSVRPLYRTREVACRRRLAQSARSSDAAVRPRHGRRGSE